MTKKHGIEPNKMQSHQIHNENIFIEEIIREFGANLILNHVILVWKR